MGVSIDKGSVTDTFVRVSAAFEMEPRPEGLVGAFGAVDVFREWLGWPREFRNNIHLVLEEIAMNVVMHSGHEGPIRFHITVRRDTMSLEVRDQGIPFDPTREADSLSLPPSFDDLPIGGLGLHLVKSLVDSMEYRREGGANHLTLRMSVPTG